MRTSPLWQPSATAISNSNLSHFRDFVQQRHHIRLDDYPALYDWSVAHSELFWPALWDFAEVQAQRRWDQALLDGDKMPGARWFVGSQLNFADNLLRRRDDADALVFRNETGVSRRLSFAQLYRQVAQLAATLRQQGVVAGDRVAGFMPNLPETVVAMLACTSIGAVWSSCSPDFGIQGVLDRFGQIESTLR